MNQPWKLEDGAKLVRALQPKVSDFGYNVAIGGGVLTTGEAEKLDLYFHPVVKADQSGLVAWLTTLWGQPDEVGQFEQPRTARPSDIFATDPNRFARILRPSIIPERFLVREDEPVVVASIASVPEPAQKTTYKQKLVFQRADNDRIDVFIV